MKGIFLHSYQGFQYTSRQYNQLLKKCQLKASMSRKGNCWNNACIESFFIHFKVRIFSFKLFSHS
ncbi:TPA: DDE-type integrase/transposase/recombinase [Bacillus cereus]|nr:DDE-type integrase/transposase/recombinase [Bacillus cereus]